MRAAGVEEDPGRQGGTAARRPFTAHQSAGRPRLCCCADTDADRVSGPGAHRRDASFLFFGFIVFYFYFVFPS